MEEIDFKYFLESVPPGKEVIVSEFTEITGGICYLAVRELNLYCMSDECLGVRFFALSNRESFSRQEHTNKYLIYVCRNCRRSQKTYSVSAKRNEDSNNWLVRKYGEVPAFGPPIPPQVFKLIGGERELFLMGRRSETQGMGIGAFVYYRRVIESQKNRIFDEIIRVVSKISPEDAVIKELFAAKNETQFTKAIESIKHGLPQSIAINGYNPLTLLHSALSEGVHAHSDDECLELASSVRSVLFEFAERLSQALKEEAELNAAVNRLANGKKS